MSLSTPSQITVAFANAGLRAAIPATANNTTGRAGYDQGFPPINLTPKVAGGIPPFGQDMNGVLYDATVAIRYLQAGNGYVYSNTFSTAVGGYNVGARVLRTDGRGYWINTTDNNTTDPESAGAAAAGWVPDTTNGVANVTMANANVTLTPLQYGRPIIAITGTITANLNLIFPVIAGQWVIYNNTTGSFSITAKTASGAGVVVSQAGATVVFGDATNIYGASADLNLAVLKAGSTMTGLLTLSGDPSSNLQAATKQYVDNVKSISGIGLTASISANAITVSIPASLTIDFRSTTLTNGAVARVIGTPANLTIASTDSFGLVTAAGNQRIAILAINNAGTIEFAATALAGGVNLDETGLITTVTAATSGTQIKAAAARSNVAYRVIGCIDATFTTGIGWGSLTLAQGAGGNALAAMQSLGYGQTWQNVTASRVGSNTTYYNTTGKPITVNIKIGAIANTNVTIGGVTATNIIYTSGMFIVPAGMSYSISYASTIDAWMELR